MMKILEITAKTLVIASVLLALSGCLSSRERMQMLREPQNNVFQAPKDIEDLNLVEDEPAAFALWNKSEKGTQSVHILQLRPDAKLTKRYHRSHDLTLQCLKGSAIIELEGERHFVQAPATIVVPRLWSYAIIPHKSDDNFTAMAVFSPLFNGDDVIVMDD